MLRTWLGRNHDPPIGRLLSLPFCARGPFRVGLREIEIPSFTASKRVLPTSVWYPALGHPNTAEQAPHAFGQPHRATLDLDPIERAFPLVLFSHGNSGSRHQSTFLTTHLASWGTIVAAPDHAGNTFFDALGRQTEDSIREAHLLARARRPRDASAVVEALLGNARGFGLPSIPPHPIGVCGHSFGGWTAIKIAARDRRIRAVCALAPASEAFVGRKAFVENELPLADDVETLILAGRQDVLVDLETSVSALHARLGPTARLEAVDGLDHFHFCDGIEVLHHQHHQNPRPHQPRPTQPMSELRGQDETHALLVERVTRFFDGVLGPFPSDRITSARA